MAEPFWQRSLDTITYADIVAFLDEEIAEGVNLEYKGAALKQNGLPNFTDEVLETLVAFANTAGGLMLYGVDEDPSTKLPVITSGIAAPTPKAQTLRDPAIPLMDRCVQAINPRIPLETKQLTIEDGPATGNKILLIRVRAGSQPPYSLNDRLIYIRNGEDDTLATVTEIEALFRRRVDRGSEIASPETMIDMNVFAYASLGPEDSPQCLIVGLTPAFPVGIIPASIETDRQFQQICLHVFGVQDAILRDPRGISYLPSLDPARRDDPSIGMAMDAGSIGLRRPLGPQRASQLDLAGLWGIMREVIGHAARWPRQIFRYSGPLLCRLAVTNLDGVVVAGLQNSPWGGIPREPFRNKQRFWQETREWSAGMSVDDLIESSMASLARQLQFPYFPAVVATVRDEMNA